METVPTSVWSGTRKFCSHGACEWIAAREAARAPQWLSKLRDEFARGVGLAFIKPQVRAVKAKCESTFGGRWFPEQNGIGILLHPSEPITYGVAVHEMCHWWQWCLYGDEPGEHDARFFALVEKAYRVFGVSLATAKQIESTYPARWQARTWSEVTPIQGGAPALKRA